MLGAAWLTAAATLGLFLGAIITAIFAIKAFGKQSDEVDLLRQQVGAQQEISKKQINLLDLQARRLEKSLAQGKQDAEQRRRAQAAQIFIETSAEWSLDPSRKLQLKARADVHNTSKQPIYHLHIMWHKGPTQLGPTDYVEILKPGQSTDFSPKERVPGDQAELLKALIYFYDANNVQWRAWSDGRLDEIADGQGYPRPKAEGFPQP